VSQVAGLKLYRAYKFSQFRKAEVMPCLTENLNFLRLVAGPRYDLELRPASLNALLISTIVFGCALPLLYPVCLAGVVVQYLNERLTLAKVYRLPQSYKSEVTQQNIQMLAVAPLISCMVVFWLFGADALFKNQRGTLSSLG